MNIHFCQFFVQASVQCFECYRYIEFTNSHNTIDSWPTNIFTFLTAANLSINGSSIIIRCEFANEYPEASCVLVYRRYNDPYLTVKEYDRSTEFPITLPVNDSEKYTFAVFGKNTVDRIEAEPVIKLMYLPSPMTSLPTTMPSLPSPRTCTGESYL